MVIVWGADDHGGHVPKRPTFRGVWTAFRPLNSSRGIFRQNSKKPLLYACGKVRSNVFGKKQIINYACKSL